MKQKWVDTEFEYDGSQLASLYNYLKHGLAGDSIVSWVGPCDISFEKMADGEDLLTHSEIRGARMLHFIIEKFDVSLFAAVALQRLVASLALEILIEKLSVKGSAIATANSKLLLSSDGSSPVLRRDGDDIYWGEKKISISVAVPSYRSCLIHFAVNITNEGTPVPTAALSDFAVDPVQFAQELMTRVACENESIIFATHKVHGVGDY